jgi:hypothetical protein
MPSAKHAAGWEDVSRIALALPEASERISRDLRQWRVNEKLFVWERPLRRREIEALGASAPVGQILGARVEHVGAKDALSACSAASPSSSTATCPWPSAGAAG